MGLNEAQPAADDLNEAGEGDTASDLWWDTSSNSASTSTPVDWLDLTTVNPTLGPEESSIDQVHVEEALSWAAPPNPASSPPPTPPSPPRPPQVCCGRAD
eukprot:COSAG02_NODE_18324_length_945_cov_1.826241_1_plen_99_part_01